MAEMVKVKLVEGRDILMEDGREWPQGVVHVEKTQYTRRRMADGDLVEVDVKAKPSETPVKGDK